MVDVPAAATLPELHELLQAAMGWVDAHLHEFVTDQARYGVPDEDGLDATCLDESRLDESRARLRDLGPRWMYRYDFGDDWVHDVEVLGRGAERPGCVGGSGGCPLEDCGGPPGHDRLRAVLADPHHPEHREAWAWAGGQLPGFDLEAADRRVRHTVGEVPETVRLLVAAIGDGVALTPAGRLPRRLVREVQQHRPHWAFGDKPASIEEDLIPLAALHEVLRAVGLLRLRTGTLHVTKAATDDLDVLRRLRSWFHPADGFVALLATDTVALLAVDGPQDHRDLSARLFAGLGSRWARGGRPITLDDVAHERSRLRAVLEALDQINVHGPRWSAGPGARRLLPRASALAELRDPDIATPQPHYARGR